jgi:hypothetical protein
MRTVHDAVIDHLGGTSAVAKRIKAPVSTVHSWRAKGIPMSRMEHLRLVAAADGCALPENLADLLTAEPERDAA